MLHKLVKIRHGRQAGKNREAYALYVPRGGGETRGECRPTSELTLDNAGGGKHWECLSLCNVGNVLQCEGKISGAMQQLALARGGNTHPGRTIPLS